MVDILVLYCSQDGSVHKLAQQIARGVNSVNGAEAKLRSVPNNKQPKNNLFAPEIKLSEIEECDGLALGSPTHFGNMSGAMKNFIDELTPLWFKGSLESKVGTVFTSSHSLHGGNEATLLEYANTLAASWDVDHGNSIFNQRIKYHERRRDTLMAPAMLVIRQ
jgi:NAD(P)H dehydrogenase (quinone)